MMPQNLILDEALFERDPKLLLGRFVTNCYTPLDNYFPDRSQSEALDLMYEKYLLPVSTETDVSRFVSSISSNNVKAQVHNLMGASAGSQVTNSIKYQSSIIKTCKLEQIRTAFEDLTMHPDISDGLREFLKSSKEVYWIVGLKTIAEGTFKSSVTRSHTLDGEIRAPISDVISAVAGGSGVLPTESMGDIGLSFAKKTGGETGGSGRLEGEQVFAMRYCPVKLVRGMAGSDVSGRKKVGLAATFSNLKKQRMLMQEPKYFSDKEGLSFSSTTSTHTLDDAGYFNIGESDDEHDDYLW